MHSVSEAIKPSIIIDITANKSTAMFKYVSSSQGYCLKSNIFSSKEKLLNSFHLNFRCYSSLSSPTPRPLLSAPVPMMLMPKSVCWHTMSAPMASTPHWRPATASTSCNTVMQMATSTANTAGYHPKANTSVSTTLLTRAVTTHRASSCPQLPQYQKPLSRHSHTSLLIPQRKPRNKRNTSY